MKSERGSGKSGYRVAALGLGMAAMVLLSFGMTGRPDADSKRESGFVIAPARTAEVSVAASESGADASETHLAGHSELTLQCD